MCIRDSVEILPDIADFFGVSIEFLFGRRTGTECRSFSSAFRAAAKIQMSLFGAKPSEEEMNSILHGRFCYSEIVENAGVSLLDMSEDHPYFLLLPQRAARAETLQLSLIHI